MWTLLLAALAQEPELPIVKGPDVLQYVDAPWPEGADESTREAIVTLEIELDAEGEVVDIQITGSAGEGFDEAAVDAVLAMRFAPAETAEGPVSVVFEFQYGFRFVEPPPEEIEAPVNLEGQVRELGTRKPLEGVTVVVDGAEELSTRTDADGRFSFRGVPIDTVRVRLLDVDHVTLERDVEIAVGEVTVLDLWMRSTSYRENEIVGVYRPKSEEMTRRTLSIEEVRRIPGTFGDPVKVVQTLPGAARSPFGTGLLVIRGSNPEDSGVYVDGVRIPLIYHLTGTTSVLSPDLIEAVDYLPGGYGPQYGRSTGGVIDVKTKSELSEQGKILWGTDILDSQVYFEGRVRRRAGGKEHQIAVGARRSYVDVFIPYFTRGQTFTIKPKYWDYQLKYIAPMPDGQHLSAFFYGFSDVLEVSTPADVAQGTDRDTQGALRTVYGSNRLALTYRNALTDRMELELTPSVGVDGSDLGLGDAFTLSNTQLVSGLRAELRVEATPAVELVPGLDLLHGSYTFDFRSATNFEDAGDPLAEREGVGFDGRGSFFSPDVYLKVNLRPLAGSDRWLVTPGIRGQMYSLASKGGIVDGRALSVFNSSVDPRILTRFTIVDGNVLKASTGMFSQPPQPQEALGVGRASNVGYERTWATSVGFEQQLTPSVRWDVDFFHKRFTDLIVFNPEYAGFGINDAFVNDGDGRAYGMEIMARHDPTGPFFGWVSYTLSRAERRDGPGKPVYLFGFDQTHIFSAQAGYDLPYDFGVSGQVQAVTGNPDTPLDAGIYDVDADYYNGFRTGGVNSERLPMFFQTSLRVDKLFTFRSWQLETYVDFLNAVRGVNPEFRIYNYDFSDSAFVRGLPFIPNVGLEARVWL